MQKLWFGATARVPIAGEWLVGQPKLASGVSSRPNFETADGISWCMDRFYSSYEKNVINLSYLIK